MPFGGPGPAAAKFSTEAPKRHTRRKAGSQSTGSPRDRPAPEGPERGLMTRSGAVLPQSSSPGTGPERPRVAATSLRTAGLTCSSTSGGARMSSIGFRKWFSVFSLVLMLVGATAASAAPLSVALDIQGQGLTATDGGVGLQGIGTGTRSLSVNIGGPVQAALLYWVGRDRACPMSGGGWRGASQPPTAL